MEPSPTPLRSKSRIVPVAVNLALLVVLAAYNYADPAALAVGIGGLVLVNGFAALLLAFFNRMQWAVAFVLAALLLPLIGLGLCALFIEMNGGLHGGH